MIRLKFKIVGLIFIVLFFSSCDQIESKYNDFDKADSDGLFDKGWIPKEFAFKSMTNIYQRTNIDLNTCFFYFNLSQSDISSIKTIVTPIQSVFDKERVVRIDISDKYYDEINKLEKYFLIDKQIPDTVFIAIDNDKKLVYGWRNK